MTVATLERVIRGERDSRHNRTVITGLSRANGKQGGPTGRSHRPSEPEQPAPNELQGGTGRSPPWLR